MENLSAEDDKKRAARATSMAKDIGEILRTRILIFIPFFGAFLAFLFSKSDYLQGTIWLTKLWCLAVFGLGAVYAQTVASLLSAMEQIRMIANIYDGFDVMPEKDRQDLSVIVGQIPKAYAFQEKLFSWTMYVLYLTGGSMLLQIMFKDQAYEAFLWVTTKAFCHFGYTLMMGERLLSCS
jgi:hypothetical protein